MLFVIPVRVDGRSPPGPAVRVAAVLRARHCRAAARPTAARATRAARAARAAPRARRARRTRCARTARTAPAALAAHGAAHTRQRQR